MLHIAALKPSSSRNNALLWADTIIAPADKEDAGFQCRALIDSGCSKTVLCYNAISASKHQDQFKIKQPERKIMMASALTDIGAVVLGKLDIDISFLKATEDFKLRTTAYVVSGLSHSCFLGSDLLCQRILRSISPDAIFLSHPAAPYVKTDPTAGCTMVPIYSQKISSGETLLAAEATLLQPGLNWVKAKRADGSSARNFSCSNLEIQIEGDETDMVVPVLHNGNGSIYVDYHDDIPHWSSRLDEDDEEASEEGVYINTLHVETIHDERLNENITVHSFHDRPLHQYPEQALPETFDVIESMKDNNDLPAEQGERLKTDDEMIKSVKMSHIPLEERVKYEEMLRQNIDVFSRSSTDIGCTHLYRGFTRVKQGIDPADFQTRYIPIAQSRIKHVNQLLKDLMKAAIIRQTTDPVPCLANIHVRVKPNGKLRLCLDSRAANYYTERFAAVTTYTLDEIISKFHGRMVSMVDVSQSFFQIPLSKESRKHFAFQGPDRKIYELLRVSQGHHNSPLFLCHAMNIILDIPTSCTEPDFEPYTPEDKFHDTDGKDDDAEVQQGPMRINIDTTGVVTSITPAGSSEEPEAPITLYTIYDDLAATSDHEGGHDLHRCALQSLFNKMRKGNVKLRLEKLQLCPDVLTILGMQYDSKYLSIPTDRFTAWRKMPVDTPKRIKGFVASLSYFRSYCPSFSRLSRELLQATKEKEFKPSEALDKAKHKLIDAMQENCRRRTISASDRLQVSTDASKYDSGATLEVINKDGSTELVASYSRLFQKHEINHDIFHKEAATMVAALKHFSFYLMGCKDITIRTDVRALLYIKSTTTRSQTSFRLSNEISKYDATIIHVPTNAHSVVDTISRTRTEDEQHDTSAEGLTPAEAECILKHIYIENGRKYTKAEAMNLISQEAFKTIVKPRIDRYGLKPPSIKPELAPKHTIVRPNFIRDTASNTGAGWKNSARSKPFISINALTDITEEPMDYEEKPSDNESATSIQAPAGSNESETFSTDSPAAQAATEEAKGEKEAETATEDKEEIAVDDSTSSPPSQTEENGGGARSVEVQTVAKAEHMHSPFVSIPLLKAAARTIKTGKMPIECFVQLQNLDPEIKGHLDKGAKSIKTLDSGIVMKNDRIYLPESLLRHAVDAVHIVGDGLHTPRSMAKRTLAATYHRSHLKDEIDRIYDECFLCSMSQPVIAKKPPLYETCSPENPREAWYIDVMDITQPVATECNCPRYAIIGCDAYSNYIVIAPIGDKAKDTLATALIQVIIAPFGKPKAIISDNESGIASDHTQSILTANKIQCHFISPRAPWANKAEGAIKQVKRMVGSMLTIKKSYVELLPSISDMLNSIPRPPTNVSAYQLFFFSERKALPGSIPIVRAAREENELVAEITRAHQTLLGERARKRAHANRSRKERVFQEGELVYVRENVIKTGAKLLAPAGELHMIHSRIGDGAYMVQNMHTKEVYKRHGSFIYPAQLSERVRLLSPEWDSLLIRQHAIDPHR